jgi:hypothetical protein
MNGTVPQMYFETAVGTKTFRVLVEVHNDGLYISRAIAAPDWGRIAEMADLEPLITEIQGLHGKTARLNGYDFGMGITSDNIDDTDIQIMLNAYAIVQLGVSDVSDIPNFIGVHNLYDGEGGNHLLIFNQAIVGSGTPENPEFPAHWVDNGLDSVSIASNTSLGVVNGSSADLKVGVETDGTMSVNGLSTKLSEKENTSNKTDVIRAADTADNEHYPTELAVRTGLDAAGRVDTVNGIEPDNAKNVQTDYVYQTEADFEADKANIPAGATVIKLYEYPDNLAGFMVIPDYAHSTKNLIDAAGGTWTVERTGFIRLQSAYNGTAYPNYYFQTGALWKINGGPVFGAQSTNGVPNMIFGIFLPVKQGDVITAPTLNIYTWNTAGEPYNSSSGCYFVPPLFVKKELPFVVEKNGSYSLDEVRTADKWTDGRWIYKKTYYDNNIPNPTTYGDRTIDTIANFMEFVRTEQLIFDGTKWKPPIAETPHGWEYVTILNAGQVILSHNWTGYKGYNATVFYTKTTD